MYVFDKYIASIGFVVYLFVLGNNCWHYVFACCLYFSVVCLVVCEFPVRTLRDLQASFCDVLHNNCIVEIQNDRLTVEDFRETQTSEHQSIFAKPRSDGSLFEMTITSYLDPSFTLVRTSSAPSMNATRHMLLHREAFMTT